MAQVSRKMFLKATALLLSVYPLKLFFDAGKTAARTVQRHKTQILPLDLPEGISFHGDIIALKTESSFRFLSSRCPHLGCRINRVEADELVCPCHGSRFSKDGRVRKGPAAGDLKELPFSIDSAKRQITVTTAN